jgi:hypothetical protein
VPNRFPRPRVSIAGEAELGRVVEVMVDMVGPGAPARMGRWTEPAAAERTTFGRRLIRSDEPPDMHR